MGQKLCHVLISDTAKAMANELYEELAKDNTFRKLNPSRRKYVKLVWGKLVPQARATLAEMLASGAPEDLKLRIEDALIKDNALRHMPHA